MNVLNRKNRKLISRLLESISKPARIQILLAIGEDEACVCHLEAVLGYRQAYISQQLMALREAKYPGDQAGWSICVLQAVR